MPKRCFNCQNTNTDEIFEVYGYHVCIACKPKLGFYQDSTIRKHIRTFENEKQIVPEKLSYREEVDQRLKFGEASYLRKRLKLLHIQARLKEIKS